MRLRFSLAALGAAVVLSAGPANAQMNCVINTSGPGSCFTTHDVRAAVNTVAGLELSSITTTMAVTAADLAAGSKSLSGPTVAIFSNTTWSLGVSATAATWTGPTGTSKSSSDLSISYGAGSPIAVTTSTQTLATGSPQPQTLQVTNITTAWTFLEPPGVYDLRLTFTLTAP